MPCIEKFRARCNSCDIGETCCHFQIRIDEHIRTDKTPFKAFPNTFMEMKIVLIYICMFIYF